MMNSNLSPFHQNLGFVVILALFFLNPLFGIAFLLLWCVYLSSRLKYSTLYFAGLIFSAFVGLVNATKLHENDLIWYVAGYLDAGSLPFVEYLLTFGRNGMGQELAFPLFNYVVFQFLGPRPLAYIFLHSFLSYSILNFSVIRFGKALEIRPSLVLMGVIIMTFTPYIFAMSAILMRQFLASAILMMILVERFFYGKRMLVWLLIMVLVHSVTIFFVPFIILPFFKRAFSTKTLPVYVLMFVAVLSIQLIATLLLPLVQSIPLLQYAVLRASTGTTYDLGVLSTTKVLVSVLTAAVPMIFLYVFNGRKFMSGGLLHFFNVCLVLVVFIIGNLHQSELSVRLNFFVWQFFPLSVLFIFKHIRQFQLVSLPLNAALIVFFVIYLDFSMWTYQIGIGILYFPIWSYFQFAL